MKQHKRVKERENCNVVTLKSSAGLLCKIIPKNIPKF